MSIRAPRTGEHRGLLYAGLGAALVGLPACTEQNADWATETAAAPQQEQAAPEKGVVTVLKETAPGEFKIDDEKVTDGPSRLVIMYQDGTVKNVTDPDELAGMVPAEPPPPNQVVRQSGGLGLGDVLLFSMIFNAWRPGFYPSHYAYAPPRHAYVSDGAYRRITQTERPLYGSYAGRGLAPTSAVQAKSMAARRSAVTRARPGASTPRVAPGARSTAPSSGRSGYFGGRGGGGFGG